MSVPRLPVIVIRPEPGGAATVAAAGRQGLDARGFPLFEIVPLDWHPVPREEVDAILIGSANAMRQAGPALADYRGLPAYAVGETTAAAARQAGLDVVRVARGGLQSVMAQLDPGHRKLLRLAGRERVDLALPAPCTMATREVYASEALPMPAELARLLQDPALVLLHSGEAAAHFASECRRLSLPRTRIALAIIGPRLIARTGEGWAAVRCAAAANDAALLALAEEMCQGFPSGS